MREIRKIILLPANEDSLIEVTVREVVERIGPCVEVLNREGEKYCHDTPWRRGFCFSNPKFYLSKVRIGAIGRIRSVEDAVLLGTIPKVYANTYHFTSTSLFLVYRLARVYCNRNRYLEKLEVGVNNLINGVHRYNRLIGRKRSCYEKTRKEKARESEEKANYQGE